MKGACGRIAASCAIAAGIVFAAPAVDSAFRAAGVEPGGNKPVGFDASDMLDGGDAVDALIRIEEALGETNGPPEWLENEGCLLPGARDVRLSGSVAGYVVDKRESDAFAEITAHMEAKGWTSVPLGGVSGATFVRESDAGAWMLVTCTQVGTATSVVVRRM